MMRNFSERPPHAVQIGPRFSIIAWGKRRTINERNGGTAKFAQSAVSF
jgi:hypothetical protein